MCCHLERERGERVRAFEGVASGGGNSDLWARVDTIVLGQACDANVQERGLGECAVFVGGRAGEGFQRVLRTVFMLVTTKTLVSCRFWFQLLESRNFLLAGDLIFVNYGIFTSMYRSLMRALSNS